MKRPAPSADRNKNPILEVLRPLLHDGAFMLEIASGSGTHVAHFATNLPNVVFQPTDLDPDARKSIEAFREELGLPNVLAPVPLDASKDEWPVDSAFGIVCINMIHITPFDATVGLFRGSARTLAPGGFLLTYGPYRFSGVFLAESNAAFDRMLKEERDPSFGVRDVDDLDKLAAAAGLVHEATVPMPANNHCLVFRKPR